MWRPTPAPRDPSSEQLLASWRSLVIRQAQGGGCLGERTALADAIAQVELRLIRRMWAEPTVTDR